MKQVERIDTKRLPDCLADTINDIKAQVAGVRKQLDDLISPKRPDKIDELVAGSKRSQSDLAPVPPKAKPPANKPATPKPKLDPDKAAQDVLPGSLRREFPSEHLGKSLNDIKGELKNASGLEKRSLQKAKKLLEQSERLLDK